MIIYVLRKIKREEGKINEIYVMAYTEEYARVLAYLDDNTIDWTRNDLVTCNKIVEAAYSGKEYVIRKNY